MIKTENDFLSRTSASCPRRLFLFLLVCIGYFHSTYAQQHQLYFHHLTTSQGLSQTMNPFIYKDSTGFVWISSWDGLNRFDGQRIKIYRENTQTKNNMVGAMITSHFFEDSHQDLWFSTDKALNWYHRKTDNFSQIPINQHTQGCTLFHRTPEGELWVQADSQLYLLNPPYETPQQVKSGRLAGDRFFVIREATSNSVKKIIALDDNQDALGFRVYTLQNRQITTEKWELAGPKGVRVNEVYPENEYLLWLATEKGLMLYDLSSHTILKHYPFLGVCWDVTLLEPNLFLIATGASLILFDKKNGQIIEKYQHNEKDPASISNQNDIQQVYVDRDKVLWVSVMLKGVDYAQWGKSKFQFLPTSRLNLPNEARFKAESLTEINPGEFWFGCNFASGLRSFDRNGGLKILEMPGIGRYNVALMRKISSGDILLSSQDQGAAWYDAPKRRFLPILGPERRALQISDFLQLNDGRIWASHATGIYQVQKAAETAIASAVPFTPLALQSVQKMYQDSGGLVYLACNSERILVADIKSPVHILAEISISGEVKTMTETDRYTWIGGGFGLLRVDKKKPENYRFFQQQDGLPNNMVYGILPHHNRDLWISTNLGIARFHLPDSSLHSYHLSDGIQDFEYNTNSYYKADNGQFWFGGIRGFNIFYPDSIKNIQAVPRIVLTQLDINDTLYTQTGNIATAENFIFKPGENTLNFHFAALEFSDPSHIRIKYQLFRVNDTILSPYDENWIECPTPLGSARYTKLKYGHYVLKVMAANSDGVWNTQGIKSVYFCIEPYFTDTPAFSALMMLLLIVFTYLGSKYYFKNKLRLKNLEIREKQVLIEKQEALQKERNRIASEMHDDLGGGLTSIRMLSRQIQNKLTQPETQTQVDKISRYAQELIQNMGEIIWAMNSDFDTVDNVLAYIRRYSVDYLETHQVRCIIQDNTSNISENTLFSGEKRRNLFLCVKESLHNAIKHSGADRINISFNSYDQQLEISVQDNGQGIPSEAINKFGNGLNNMRKRMNSVHGQVEFRQHEGTLIIFTLPIDTTTSHA